MAVARSETNQIRDIRTDDSGRVYTISSGHAAVTLQDNAATAVASTAVALVAANPSRRSLRITNLGPDPVALGAAGITWVKRCIVLNAGASTGDTHFEDNAANLAWYAICDAGKSASVTTQEVLS